MSKLKEFFINLMPDWLVYVFAKPYLGGNNLDEGVQTAKDLWVEKSLSSTMDLLGEDLEDKKAVEHAVNIYLKLVDQIKEKDMNSYTTISVKPSSLGYLISSDYYLKQLEKVVKYAYEKDVEIAIDMEDHRYTDVTLASYKKLKPSFPTLGTVLQTRLFRTDQDIAKLGEINARIRLCIGIYKEPKDIAFTNKRVMKERMVKFAEELIESGHFVAFATHDEKYLNEMLEIADKNNYTSEQLEFQMLLGVPRKRIQQDILNSSYVMRLYVPFAEKKENAIAYLRRRLYENPFMVFSVLKNMLRTLFKGGK